MQPKHRIPQIYLEYRWRLLWLRKDDSTLCCLSQSWSSPTSLRQMDWSVLPESWALCNVRSTLCQQRERAINTWVSLSLSLWNVLYRKQRQPSDTQFYIFSVINTYFDVWLFNFSPWRTHPQLHTSLFNKLEPKYHSDMAVLSWLCCHILCCYWPAYHCVTWTSIGCPMRCDIYAHNE